jgi:hypothetical protein
MPAIIPSENQKTLTDSEIADHHMLDSGLAQENLSHFHK